MKVYFPSPNHWAKEQLLCSLGLCTMFEGFCFIICLLFKCGRNTRSIPLVSKWFGSPFQPLTLDKLRSMLQGAIQRTL